MGRPKRSESATEASWGFMDRPEVVDLIERMARSRKDVPSDDLGQELYLWFGVRPELHDLPVDHIAGHLRRRVKSFTDANRKVADMEVGWKEWTDERGTTA